ncbi:MAG: low molecular weight protein-tyrosine-phosphatase [Sphingobacteriaceae bacterium]
MKILMVCLGNICRSPLAHGVMEHLAKTAHLNWEIDSAGTGNWHVGNPPDPRSIAVGLAHGIDISDQRARQFQESDFNRFDRIFVMDNENLKNVLALAQTEEQKQKVSLLLGEVPVPDPYWDNSQFEPVYQMIEQACQRFIEQHQ